MLSLLFTEQPLHLTDFMMLYLRCKQEQSRSTPELTSDQKRPFLFCNEVKPCTGST